MGIRQQQMQRLLCMVHLPLQPADQYVYVPGFGEIEVEHDVRAILVGEFVDGLHESEDLSAVGDSLGEQTGETEVEEHDDVLRLSVELLVHVGVDVQEDELVAARLE